VATYQDLLDAIARIRAGTGDVSAWMTGLSGDDLVMATSPVMATAPGAVDAVLAKIQSRHPDVFTPPNAPPPPPVPGSLEGSAAEAIRSAETSLAQQNSATAQLDLQIIAAVLNAHSTHSEGRAALDELQRNVEAAVATRTDLDTPAGARGFQRYLIGKLRDIRTVVETAGLDATSKASLAAALASLYTAAGSAALPASTDPERPPAASEPPDEDQPPPDPGADPLLDRLLGGDLDAPPGDTPAGSGAAPAPMIPGDAHLPANGRLPKPGHSDGWRTAHAAAHRTGPAELSRRW